MDYESSCNDFKLEMIKTEIEKKMMEKNDLIEMKKKKICYLKPKSKPKIFETFLNGFYLKI